jgi:signal transduction histidine kinase
MTTASSPRKVLVVDDDEGLTLLMVDALQTAGIEAYSSLSGKHAFASLKQECPLLMLLDLKLTDFSGSGLLERLEQERISVPFIVVTGQGDERVAVEMMKRGALDYLIKDTGMLERLPVVVKRATEKLERDRALTNARSALLESEKKILLISEEERQRIGADLHDNLGQHLTAIELLCHSLRQDLQHQPPLESQMAQICRYLQEAVAQTRQLARGLMPVSLEAEGIRDALAELARRMSQGSLHCEFICAPSVEVRDNNVANQLYRIAQEAINNATKHGGAKEITVKLSQRKNILKLEVEDDGHGFREAKETTAGLGLEIMRHRADVIGATLEISSTPNKGVRITCSLPENE